MDKQTKNLETSNILERQKLSNIPPEDAKEASGGAILRRDILMRTPPRSRTYSLPEQMGKRKRLEDTETLEKDQGNPSNQDNFKVIMEQMSKHIKQLEKVLQEMYKPKKEVTDISGKLVLQLEKLQRAEMRTWLDEVIHEKEEGKNEIELRKENMKLQAQLMNMEAIHRANIENLIPNKVQCESCKTEQRKQQRRHFLTKDDSYDCFKLATEEDWRDEIFPKISKQDGNIWEVDNDYSWILPCSKNLQNPQKSVGGVIERLGGKHDLLKQNRGKGEVSLMIHSLGFPDEEGNLTHKVKLILYPIILDEGANGEADDENIFKSFREVKSLMIKHGKKKLAIPEMGGITGIMICRVLEFLFVNTGIEIVLIKEKYRQPSGRKQPSSRTVDATKQMKPRQEALLVKNPNVSYADLLRKVKEMVNPSDIGVEIREVKKTRSGELLLTIKDGVGKLEALKGVIQESVPEVSTSLLLNRKIIHIKDMDETITIEEVREAVSEHISVKLENIEIRALTYLDGQAKCCCCTYRNRCS